MKTVYKILAYVVAAEVAIQAMAMVYGDAGFGKWIEAGGVADKSLMESDAMPFPEIVGFIIHGMNGMMVIPVIALLLLISSFFTKIPGAVKAAALVLLLVVVQVSLGLLGHTIPVLGALHGLNALLLFSSAIYAARRGRDVPSDEREARLATQG
jgi:heme A synthase